MFFTSLKLLKTKNFLPKTNFIVLVLFLVSYGHAQSPKKRSSKFSYEELTKENRIQYQHLKKSATKHLQNQKLFSCLIKIHEARSIFNKDTDLDYIKALCHAQIQDIDKALSEYDKVLNVYPNHLGSNINILEIYFYSKNYKQFILVSNKLRTLYRTKSFPINQIPLMEFKRLICVLKLSETDVSYTKELQTLMSSYSINDDTPFIYYANALKYFHKEKQEKANNRIIVANYVFGSNGLASWNKALTISGYMPQHMFYKLLSFPRDK